MRIPNALIVIMGSKDIAFRLQNVPYYKFRVYLVPFKKRFPKMVWDSCNKQWILPVDQLQPLYELCRSIFHPRNIRIVSDKYSRKPGAIQLPLIDE